MIHVPVFDIDGKSIDQIVMSLNSELCAINTWLQSNKLSLNAQKSVFMVFHRARRKLQR